jgi:RimJ/RimL family protein N-acetyltransferase
VTVQEPQIRFVRLTEVPLAAVLELLNEPRNDRHMPLSGRFSEESARDWVLAKDGQWQRHGYGPEAVLLDGALAGWGGIQREETGADFALVLLPRNWGHGLAITRAALDRGFGELGLDEVTIALPFTRNPDRIVARLGFEPVGETSLDGARFRQYRLTRRRWSEHSSGQR